MIFTSEVDAVDVAIDAIIEQAAAATKWRLTFYM